MLLRDAKIPIPQIPGEWIHRTRSGHTNIWNYTPNKSGLPEVRLDPPQRGLFAERIDGAWYWVCGCELCRGKPTSYSHILCEEHDHCVTCKCTRAQLTDDPWGVRDGGWRCGSCQGAIDLAAKNAALAAASATGHGENDCAGRDSIVCPYCAIEHSAEDRGSSVKNLACETCEGVFDLEVEWSASYTTTKAKQAA